MTRWLTALLMLAAAVLAAPGSAHAQPKAREAASCCGGACACGPGCTCASGDDDGGPSTNEAPAPARERDDRPPAAIDLHGAARTDLLESRACAAPSAPAPAAARPAGRELLRRIARCTT